MFRVLQDLAFLHPGDTDWTLLLSYSSYRPTTETNLDQGSGGLLMSRASINRLSGGLSVRF